MKQRRPTQADVAKQAGVSTATVSKVLNPKGSGTVRVGAETAQRVMDAIQELGYVPNPVARSLAGGRTRLLGVFSFESIFPVAQRDFYFPFLLGIEQAAEERGFDLLLFTSASREGRPRRIFQDGVNRLQLADGGILLGRTPPKDELARLDDAGYPFVCLGRREVPGSEISYVAADYTGATAEVVAHFTELGHRRIAYLGEPNPDESAADRARGYVDAARAHDLHAQPVSRLRPATLDGAWLEKARSDGVTALLLETDDLARRVESLAKDLGWTLPSDMSFAVLGDPLNPATGEPTWTMFHIPREAMGRQCLDVLLDLLDDPSAAPTYRVLPCSFAAGTSSAPPP